VWKRDFDNDTGFHKISNLNTSSPLQSLTVAPSNSNVIWIATLNKLYRTITGGASWKEITLPTNAPITYIAIDILNSNKIWISFGQFSDNGVYESSDDGNTWLNISEGLPEIPINCIIQNRVTKELYVGTDIGVYVKSNTNWMQFSTGLPNVVVTELEITYSDNKIKASTYGRGLWESDVYVVDEEPSYCKPTQVNSTYEWIQDVNFNGITHPTGNNGGYIDNNIVIGVGGNTEVFFTLTPGFENWSTYEYWNIWIDYNMNNEYETNEVVFSSDK